MPVVANQRVTSVDILRGLTIAFMILVNDPGDGGHVFAPLEHAAWNGWTPTDLVFPTFLFLVGVATVFSIDGRVRSGVPRQELVWQIARRAGLLFLIKAAISLYPYFHYTHMRLFGVLTRIALCYLVTASLYVWTRSAKTILGISIALLLGYWAMMRFVPIPGIGIPTQAVPLLDPDQNLAAWIDRGFSAFTLKYLHTGTLYEHTRDPEGLLSTLPSVATTMIGVWCGSLLRSTRKASTVAWLLLATGLFDLCAGLLWNRWFPINKNLWTSSYVLFAAGIAEISLSVLHYLFDVKKLQEHFIAAKAAIWPWLVFGSNAITAFILSNVFVKTALFIKIPHGDKKISLWGWIYFHWFSHGNSTEWTSLAFALCFVLICFVPVWFLWRKGIILRV